MKSKSAVIITILMISFFATAFIIADDSKTIEDSIATENAITTDEVIQTGTNASEIAEVSSEAETITPSQLAPAEKQIHAGTARVTAGEGFAISSDKTKGEIVSALWVSGKYISVDSAKLKEIRTQYKGQPNKIKEEIAKLATNSVVVNAAGRLVIGFGDKKEKFKMFKKEFSNKSVNFYLLSINSNMAELKNLTDSEISAKSVGTLALEATKYPNLALWNGKAVINSGKYSGTWDVTAYSKSKTFEKSNLGKGEKEEGKGEGAKAKDEKKKPGFLKRFMFWRKN